MTGELAATGLRFDVAGRVVLEDVSLRASGGQVLAVRGPSGSGKSSLLAVLGGLVRPAAGTVTLDGTPLTVGGDAALRRRFGLVLQGYGLVASLTAWENVAVSLQAAGTPQREWRSRVSAVLTRLGLAGVAEHLVDELSGGQQQRVAVARALVADPDVVLADEPTAELDGDNRALVVSMLVERARAGSVVVVASHDPDVVAACHDVLDL